MTEEGLAPEWIAKIIAREGPLPLSRYMALCLTDPHHGYYGQEKAIGEGGDFTTAPEISPLFGEMVGLWLLQAWLELGAPTPWILAELGPGRGTLVRDVLRAFRLRPEAQESLEVHLIEVSASMRQRQAASLEGMVPAGQVSWHENIDTLPEKPTLFLANEFFDALPADQFWRQKSNWYCRAVAMGEAGNLAMTSMPAEAPDHVLASELKDGEVIEHSESVRRVCEAIGARLGAREGAALIIDYGYPGPAVGDSFQALFHGAFADPLLNPGRADLTFHVDFNAVGAALQAPASAPVIAQGDFLTELGILLRLQQLRSTQDQAKHKALHQGVNRLIEPSQMGQLFKVFAAASTPLAMPPWRVTQ